MSRSCDVVTDNGDGVENFHLHQDDEAALRDGHGWVAQFAPLVMPDDRLPSVVDLHERLQLIESLRLRGPRVRSALSLVGSEEAFQVRQTVDRAMTQLDTVEKETRKQIAALAPGSEAGEVNLQHLSDVLSEREARAELGIETSAVPTTLELETSPQNLARGGFLGVFGLGWLAFTTLHAVFMIGGMVKAFGPVGLALLLFYAIFYFAGFGMLYGGFLASCSESIRVEGAQMTVTRKLGPIESVKTFDLDVRLDASLQVDLARRAGQQVPSLQRVVQLTQMNGDAVQIGAGTTHERRDYILQQLNRYLAHQRRSVS